MTRAWCFICSQWGACIHNNPAQQPQWGVYDEATDAVVDVPAPAPVNGAPAPPTRPYTKSDERWLTSTYLRVAGHRSPVDAPQLRPRTKKALKQAQKAWAALAPTRKQPDTLAAPRVPGTRVRSARMMVCDSYQQHNVTRLADSFLNRIIDERFPFTEFSDMQLIPLQNRMMRARGQEEEDDDE
jgi:hypothetical protein